MEVGKKLLDIEIKLESVNSEPEISIKDVTVLGVNHTYFVVDDLSFNKYRLEKDKHNFYSMINDVTISDYTNDKLMRRIMGQFRIHMVTDMTKKRAENKINREFNKLLNAKVSEYATSTNIKISLGG